MLREEDFIPGGGRSGSTLGEEKRREEAMEIFLDTLLETYVVKKGVTVHVLQPLTLRTTFGPGQFFKNGTCWE